MTTDIPIENLADFLGEDLSAAVWWSPADQAVLGCFVETTAAGVWGAHDVRAIVSRRPAKCIEVDEDDDSCTCDHLCLGELQAAIIDSVPPCPHIEWFTDYGHPEHPGPEKLEQLLERWASAGMGWV